MTRRGFVAGAPWVLPLALRQGAVERGIVDAHVHFYDPARPRGVPWPSKTDRVLYRTTLPDRYVNLVKPFGVTGAIVIEASPWLGDNQWLLDLAKTDRVILAVIGNLDPAEAAFAANMESFARNKMYRGIRLSAERLHKTVTTAGDLDRLKVLDERGLTIDVLGEGSAFLKNVVVLSELFPNLRIVIDHLPFEDSEDMLRAFRDRNRVYAKVSGILKRVGNLVPEDVGFYRESLDRIWDIFGQDRVVYASNWPVSDLVAPYADVLRVNEEYMELKTPPQRAKYFHENSELAYGWTTRT